MQASRFAGGLSVSALLLLGGCVTPGPADYAAASRYHQQAADQHAYNAAHESNTARWRARYGDQYGAAQAESAARAESQAAQTEQMQANKDSWLSQW